MTSLSASFSTHHLSINYAVPNAVEWSEDQDITKRFYIAIADYVPEAEGELPLAKGDMIELIEEHNSLWSRGILVDHPDRLIGDYPSSCVIPLDLKEYPFLQQRMNELVAGVRVREREKSMRLSMSMNVIPLAQAAVTLKHASITNSSSNNSNSSNNNSNSNNNKLDSDSVLLTPTRRSRKSLRMSLTKGLDLTRMCVMGTDEIITEGVLREPKKVLLRETLKERYFILYKDELVYYRKKGSRKEKKTFVPLNEDSIVQEEKSDKSPYTFSISRPGVEKKFLIAENEKEYQNWISTLAEVIDYWKNYHAHITIEPDQ